MATVMLNHREHRCYYNPVVGIQDTSDESDEATSHPIMRVPSQSGAATDREIVDVDTLEQKSVEGNTAFVVRGLVVEKVRTDVSFCYVGCAYCKTRMIVDDHRNLRSERHGCLNGNTCFHVRVRFVESAKGRSIWLTLFDQCMADLLDVDAKDFSFMHESIQMSKLNTLVGTRISLTIKRKVNETATPTTTSLT
ncbi:hypothetical protein NP493_508g01031 [Ridgeia piscesae]|uniref:Uncharacterized protein n=1 Tax=Ridgeia piscesae TaxID=27915 RepID=A0AAD9KX55_RIDPI|nr:hypothetical protein NP493_508g01031 [Ridgeia piscesae]